MSCQDESFGLEPTLCPHCGAHLKLVGKPSYEGGEGQPICLNACHLGVAGQRASLATTLGLPTNG